MARTFCRGEKFWLGPEIFIVFIRLQPGQLVEIKALTAADIQVIVDVLAALFFEAVTPYVRQGNAYLEFVFVAITHPGTFIYPELLMFRTVLIYDTQVSSYAAVTQIDAALGLLTGKLNSPITCIELAGSII